MSQDKPNPYNAAGYEATAFGEPSMRYIYAFQYVLERTDWFVNLLLVTLCAVIPVVGPIVFLGYKMELIEALHRDPKRVYPAFEFGRFADYLTRGVWPFLAALILQMILVPITFLFIIPMFCAMGFAVAASEQGDSEVLGVLCIVASYALIFVGSLALNLLSMMFVTPMMLAAGLAQELGPALKFSFIKDFVGRVWREMLLGYLFLMAVSMVITPLGLLVFCVGVYIAMAWVWMAMAHLFHQYYEIYLARGGTAIPLKEKG